MKVRISDLCPERGTNYRIETFKEAKVEKAKKKTSSTSGEVSGTESGVETYATEVIEIKRNEIVHMFPEENLEAYLRGILPRKILGCFKDIRTYFDYSKKPDEGGCRGLKKPFEMAWNVKIHSIDEMGDIIPIGYVKRFQYKGGRGGMGTERFDLLDKVELTLTVNNLPIKVTAPHIEKQAIKYLEQVRFGPARYASMEIMEVLEE